MTTTAKTWPIDPTLPSGAAPVLAAFRRAVQESRCQPTRLQAAARTLLTDPALAEVPEKDRVAARLLLEVFDDLVHQGWCFEMREGRLFALPPDASLGEGADQREIKQRLRASLAAARTEQLREETNRRFIRDMERPRRWKGREVSVLNHLLSGEDLAADLRRRQSAPASIRQQLLDEAIQPYLQRATDDRDPDTNLRLVDIWRYCRYTWSLPLSAQPGRQMLYLVRDAARPFHPIVGIGALGNSVVQITRRDYEIGWTLESLGKAEDPADRMAALERGLNEALEDVYWADLVSGADVSQPSETVLATLASVAGDGAPMNVALRRAGPATADSDDPSDVFRRKRAKELESLLRARRTFQVAQERVLERKGRLAHLLADEEGRRAIRVALRAIKKRHIGSSIMDITTCGAMPPYGELLGGKLVSLLMSSPQVIADYRDRYGEAASEIASKMKGEDVIRPASLVLLGTTSLYHVGSSQYNRLQADAAHGKLRFLPSGQTEGFGSVHISQRTYRTMQELLRSHPDLRPESSTFAAGVNFKLRSIGTALGFLGLSRLQNHKSPRLVYLVPLATNWREYLTGRDATPRWIYEDLAHPQGETQALIDYWRRRWFLPRLARPETLPRLAWNNAARVSDLLRGDSVEATDIKATDTELAPPHGGGGTHLPPSSRLTWRALAELVESRTSFAEQLSPEELEALHIPTELDARLLDLAREGRRLYLSGNPGDGKTHLIRRLQPDLEALGAVTSLDASAEDEEEFFQKVVEAQRRGVAAVLAINEGPLRRLRPRLPGGDADVLEPQLNRPYVYGDDPPALGEAILVNLGLRQSLARAFVDGVFHLIQNRVDYDGAPEAIRRNQSLLARPRVRERLARLLELVAMGGAHVTMHELLAFMAHAVTGGVTRVEDAVGLASYADLVFSPRSPFRRWLTPFDPVALTHPLVDMALWDGEPRGTIEWLDPPGVPVPGSLEDPAAAQTAFRTLKRRYYFEAAGGDALLDLIPPDRKAYYDLLDKATSARETSKVRLVEALALFFRDRPDQQGHQLRVWTGLRYEAGPPTAYVSSQAIPVDWIDLDVPRLRPEVRELLEYRPSHVRLAVRPQPAAAPVGLDLDLELWMTLMSLKRGMPTKHHDPVLGRRLHNFMGRLAAAAGARPNYLELQVRDAERGATYAVSVSLEGKKKYRW